MSYRDGVSGSLLKREMSYRDGVSGSLLIGEKKKKKYTFKNFCRCVYFMPFNFCWLWRDKHD